MSGEKRAGSVTGRRIAEARRVRGLTQRELAEKVEVATITISFWECGRKGISMRNLKAVARNLHVRTDWLLGVPGAQGPAVEG